MNFSTVKTPKRKEPDKMKRLVLVCLVAASCSSNEATSTRRSALDSTLVAAYNFDEGSGTTAHDATANHLDGTLAGPGWSGAGKFGGALACGSGYATVPDANVLDLTTGMTLEAWIYPQSNLGTWQAVAGKERPGNFAYMLFASNATKPITRLTTSSGAASDLAAGTKPAQNQWTHLAATFDGSTLRLYENGTLQGSKADNQHIGMTSNPFRICGQSGSNVTFAGLVDDLRVYNRALSATEIATDMVTPVGDGGGGTGGSGGSGGTGGSSGSGGSAGASGSGGSAGQDAGSDASDASADTGGSTGGTSGTSGSGGAPSLGAHAVVFTRVGQMATTISTTLATQPTGSTFLANVARGNKLMFSQSGAIPTDNKGNPPYPQLGVMHAYVHPNEFSGTALYGLTGALGGVGTTTSTISGAATNGNYDEATMAVVEIVGGAHVQDVQWNEPAWNAPNTSASVTTTGPALLVAFWWGEGATFTGVIVDSGFQVIDVQSDITNAIQTAVAVKPVAAAGTYNLTWTPTPSQGAQLWLVAVQ